MTPVTEICLLLVAFFSHHRATENTEYVVFQPIGRRRLVKRLASLREECNLCRAVAEPLVIAAISRRPMKNTPFCPITALGSNFNPRNTPCIPPVKIFAFLELEQNRTFFKGLQRTHWENKFHSWAILGTEWAVLGTE